MKNKKIFISSIVILVLIVGSFLFLILKPKTYKEITFKEFQQLLNQEEPFVLFIGSNDCSHCTKFKKTANRIVNDFNITINYIDISKLSDKEYAKINSNFPFAGTPTTIVIKNGQEYNRSKTRIDGARDYNTAVKRLKNANIIK